MTEEVNTHSDSIHPTHCPRCQCKWEFESQISHECENCGYGLHGLGLKQFASYFVPVLAWLIIGYIILRIAGRHYHG